MKVVKTIAEGCQANKHILGGQKISVVRLVSPFVGYAVDTECGVQVQDVAKGVHMPSVVQGFAPEVHRDYSRENKADGSNERYCVSAKIYLKV